MTSLIRRFPPVPKQEMGGRDLQCLLQLKESVPVQARQTNSVPKQPLSETEPKIETRITKNVRTVRNMPIISLANSHELVRLRGPVAYRVHAGGPLHLVAVGDTESKRTRA